MKMRSLISRGALIPALLFAVSACTAPGGGAPEATEASQEAVPVEVEMGPGDFDLPEPRAGLAGLSSYRAALTVAFDGTEAGQARQWSSAYELSYSREPAARQLTIQQTGVASEDEPQLPEYLAEKGGASYERLADGNCTANAISSEDSLMDLLEPARNLRTVFGADAAGHESVNGIEADKYTFDQRALVRKGIEEAAGEMWIAAQGGYIVRYLVTARGNADFFGEGAEGTITLEYNLTEVDQPITIELPADCPLGLVTVPMLPDATILQNLPGVLQYETATAAPEARAFYEVELPKLGWTAPVAAAIPEGMSAEEYQQALEMLQSLGMAQPGVAAASPTPDPNQAYVFYLQGAERLDVVITQGTASTSVLIMQSRSTQ